MTDRQFSSENLLLSTVGHLALAAVMVTSFAIIVERAKLVPPDRIEITEIDLSQVKITREETNLYNAAAPDAQEPKKANFPEPSKKTNPEPEGDDKPINAPSMAEPEQSKDKPKENKKSKIKRVVRVNRENVSLNRTMTVSVVDALRVALTRCWVIDAGRADIADIRAVAHLTMRRDGMVRDVWFESAARADNDPAFAYVLDTIRGALGACQPFRMLPASEFNHWEKIQLTFYPTQGKIM
jgi:hypothetical protein